MAHQLNEYCGICPSHLYEDEQSGVVYCPACGELNAEYYAEVERLRNEPFIDGATFDGIRICKVCADYETTSPDGTCWRCKEQAMIDRLG